MARGKATTLILAMFFLLILSLSIVYAQKDENQFTVKVREVTNEVEAGGEARYDFIITNNQAIEDVVTIKYDELKVYPFSDFARTILSTPSQLKLQPGETGTIEVYIRVLDAAAEDTNHEIDLTVQSLVNPDSKEVISLKTFVISGKGLISVKTNLPETIAPGRNIPFVVSFTNKGNVILDNIEVYVTSEIYSDSRILDFSSGETKDVEFIFDIDPATKPGEYTLNIRLYKDQKIKGVYTDKFTVIESPFINEKRDIIKGFLTKTLRITNSNDGNSAVERKVIIPLTFIQRIFTRANPKPVVEDGKLTWSFTVDPGKEYTVEVTTDYRIPAVIILIILVFIGLVIYILNKGVHIKKRVFKIKTDEEEEEAELKILLHIRNKKDKEIKDVRVIDMIPNLVIPTKEFGTLKPSRVQKGSSGMRFIWEIPILEPGEERIISYKVRTKLHVFGKLELPPASVQHTDEKGSIVSIHSNSAGITE